MKQDKKNIIFTIGHSNHPVEKFIALLKQHAISLVTDVRSEPYSRYCMHFNKAELEGYLKKEDIRYLYMGKELGARPNSDRYYDGNKVNLDKLLEGEEFRQGMHWLLVHVPDERMALMCAEKDPLYCHRMIILSRQLKSYHIDIKHILEDGTLEDQHQAEVRMVDLLKIAPTLFEPDLTEAELIEQAYEKQKENISFSVEQTP